MNIYVETNFILELAFSQEQIESCEEILDFCEGGGTQLVLPAFCIAESYEAIARRAYKRAQAGKELSTEFGQLSRSKLYEDAVDAFQSVTRFLARTNEEEDQRLIDVLARVLDTADVISVESSIVQSAATFRTRNKLGPQDSIVYASVQHHLAPNQLVESCFINRNRHDFDDPDIEQSLADLGCKLLFRFDSGIGYVRNRLSNGSTGE